LKLDFNNIEIDSPSKNFCDIYYEIYKRSLDLFAYFINESDWSHLNNYPVSFKDILLK
jgi:hypothetical protein